MPNCHCVSAFVHKKYVQGSHPGMKILQFILENFKMVNYSVLILFLN